MRFKTHEIKQQWESGKLHKDMTWLLTWLDDLAVKSGLLKDGIMITSLYRQDDPNYHGKWQAADIRTWGWSRTFVILVTPLLNLFRETNNQMQHEFKTMIVRNGRVIRGEHMHLEIDDNSLSKDEN